MRTPILPLIVCLLVPIPACEDGEATGGVTEAEARQVCRDGCEKAEECFMAGQLETCLDGCESQGGSDTDGDNCTPQEEQAILDHFRGCNAGSCDDYLTCIQSAPGCGG